MRFTNQYVSALFATLLFVAGCGKISQQFSPENNVSVDNDRRVKIGMTREQVVAKLDAASRTNWFDSGEPYFGTHFADEDRLPKGVKIEIWNYPDKHGTREIWFLKNSNTVWHTSFCGKNVRF
ncbi:MAG: hypothetical protein WCO56_09260 [Verrucomicrobiota bacterium]